MYASDAVVTDNVLRDNSVGIFLMYGQNLTLHRNIVARNRGPSGFGLGLKDIDGVDAHDNAFIDNRVGLHVDNSPSRFDLTHVYRRNLFANNDIALGFMPNVRNNQFTENTFFDNIEQVAVFGGGNTQSNTFAKNYWSDYRGYDANSDGIGDVPHRSQSIFENLMDRDSRMRLFLVSPAQQAIDLASRAFPICKPQLRATDQAPLMAPMRIELPKEKQHTLPASFAGLALLATGGSLMTLARKSFGANHERATH
jgi:nitrous oxidase accessory protein